MPFIKNVAHVGAAGNVGGPVLSALIESGQFNLTVITRPGSSRTFPSGVTVRTADYDSYSALAEALSGQDAVVITTGSNSQEGIAAIERRIIDAAVAAGVKHIVPNHYSADLAHEPALSAEIFSPKVKNQEYLKVLAAEGKITHTGIATGPFLDWGLTYGFLMFDLANKKATLFNDQPKVNYTTIDSIATAVVNAVSNPELVKNRAALIHDVYVTQQEILAILEEQLGPFSVTYTTTESYTSEPNPINLIQASTWGAEPSSSWGVNDDSKSLGLKKKDLKEEVVKALKSGGLVN